MNKQVVVLKFVGLFLVIIGFFLKTQGYMLGKPVIVAGLIVGLISFGLNFKNVMFKKK